MQRIHEVPPAPAEAGGDGQRLCSRDAWCADPRLTPVDGGGFRRDPALCYQAFCPADQAVIGEQLGELPEGWARMAADIGDPLTAGLMIRVPFGPTVPLSEFYDALMRSMAVILCGWEARVRANPRLGLLPRNPAAPVNTHSAVTKAAETLAGNLSVLIALPPKWMTRTEPLALGRHGQAAVISEKIEAEYGDTDLVRLGVDSITIGRHLDGADAGLEILALHRECQRALGEVAPHPELLDGIPCRTCDTMGLERAEPPSDPDTPAMYSRCPDCHAAMDLQTYRDWVDWYAQWVKGLGPVTCRRCILAGQDPERSHQECIYEGCACALAAHVPGLGARCLTRLDQTLICG